MPRRETVDYFLRMCRLMKSLFYAQIFVSTRKPLVHGFMCHSLRVYYSLMNNKKISTLSMKQISSLSASPIRSSLSPYWERLGQPETIMAPMVSQSDLAFRHLCRDYGTQLCFSQMIHSKNFVSGTNFQQNHLDVYREKKERILLTHSGLNALDNLDWNWDRLSLKSGLLKNDYDRILRHEKESTNLFTSWSEYTESALIVQIAGHDPEVMSSAARKMLSLTNSADTDIGSYQGSISGIDINCGCPQGIAKKGRYGAFLMEESVDTVCNILKKLRNDLPETVGVSAKIRIPKQIETNAGKIEMKTRIHKLIDAGCDMITVHGRNIEENKTKCRSSNWDAIALAVQIAREYSDYENYPVIANGGLEVPSDVSKMMDYTKASAVMSAEALLENPGIFLPGAVDDNEITPAKLFERQINYCYEYLDLCVQYPPLPVSMGNTTLCSIS